MMGRVGLFLVALGLVAATCSSAEVRAPKTLRVAFEAAETGFDPPQVSDGYSMQVCAHIFESLYGYDPLARPAKIRPRTAAGEPEVSADFRTWTVRVQPGVFFADDPAFNGKPRELTAQDYVYTLKRFADPANKSPRWTTVDTLGIVGLRELRERALKGEPFDYDREIDGLRALDRFTIRFRFEAPRPRLLESLGADVYGAVAREVVEAYRDRIMEHPVGTGPFRLAQWRRTSQIVLERNPLYREARYDAQPAAEDAEGRKILARLKGRRMPMVDRVVIAIIDENQPRWLAFVNGDLDASEVPNEFLPLAMPNGKIAPSLARRGIHGYRELRPRISFTYFNMNDPVVGGTAPEKIALRRAVALAMDVRRQIRVVRGGQAIIAHGPVPGQTSAFDPALRSENGEYSPVRAKALLDTFGFLDRHGDGWRSMPDGSPLVIELASEPEQISRRYAELMQRDLAAIGIRMRAAVQQWPENIKAARAGKLAVWSLSFEVPRPDSVEIFDLFNSSSIGGFNFARLHLPEMDALIARMDELPDGPERDAVFDRANRLAIAYMPYKFTVHRVTSYLSQPWLIGYREPLFTNRWYDAVDIDDTKQTR